MEVLLLESVGGCGLDCATGDVLVVSGVCPLPLWYSEGDECV